VKCGSSYETDLTKSEGKRFLDFGSGSSRRGLEEPLVEFAVGFVKLAWWANFMCLEEETRLALVPLSDQPSRIDSELDAAVVYVPFDFVVGEMLLPAGSYDLLQTEIPDMLALRRNGCRYPAALVKKVRSERESPQLLFYRQENLYFLAQVLSSETYCSLNSPPPGNESSLRTATPKH